MGGGEEIGRNKRREWERGEGRGESSAYITCILEYTPRYIYTVFHYSAACMF